MKLGKEEIQKIFLGVLLLIGVVYSYFNLLLGPLKRRQSICQQNITALEPEIALARAQIKKTEAIEASAPQARATVAQIDAMIPEGSPVAWFPTRIQDFFKKAGIDKSSTRMNSEYEDKNLSGFRKIAWGVDLPKVEFIPFATAVADLENSDILLEIGSIQIDASRDEVETQHVALTVHNIVKQNQQ